MRRPRRIRCHVSGPPGAGQGWQRARNLYPTHALPREQRHVAVTHCCHAQTPLHTISCPWRPAPPAPPITARRPTTDALYTHRSPSFLPSGTADVSSRTCLSAPAGISVAASSLRVGGKGTDAGRAAAPSLAPPLAVAWLQHSCCGSRRHCYRSPPLQAGGGAERVPMRGGRDGARRSSHVAARGSRKCPCSSRWAAPHARNVAVRVRNSRTQLKDSTSRHNSVPFRRLPWIAAPYGRWSMAPWRRCCPASRTRCAASPWCWPTR